MVGKSVLTTRDWIPESSPESSRRRSMRIGGCVAAAYSCYIRTDHETVTDMGQDVDSCHENVLSILDLVLGVGYAV